MNCDFFFYIEIVEDWYMRLFSLLFCLTIFLNNNYIPCGIIAVYEVVSYFQITVVKIMASSKPIPWNVLSF